MTSPPEHHKSARIIQYRPECELQAGGVASALCPALG